MAILIVDDDIAMTSTAQNSHLGCLLAACCEWAGCNAVLSKCVLCLVCHHWCHHLSFTSHRLSSLMSSLMIMRSVCTCCITRHLRVLCLVFQHWCHHSMSLLVIFDIVTDDDVSKAVFICPAKCYIASLCWVIGLSENFPLLQLLLCSQFTPAGFGSVHSSLD